MFFRLQLIRLSRRLRARRHLGFVAIGLALAVSLLIHSALVLLAERGVNDSVETFGDAVWFSLVSVTTIGYGDISPVSSAARVSTVAFIMVTGLALFSVFFGMVIDGINDAASRALRGATTITADNHVLIVHFPSEQRVRQLIAEIRADSQFAGEEIVIVSNEIEELPIREEGVLFIRGSTHDAETYHRASAGRARLAIVLSPDYADPASDAVVAAAVSVIEGITPEKPGRIYTVAECQQDKHRALFRTVRCDAIVSGMKMAGNLLVQEMSDPGISRVVEVLTSNREGATLYSTRVSEGGTPVRYAELSTRLVTRGFNLISVLRQDDAHTVFESLESRAGDRVIYVGRERLSWEAMLAVGA